MRNLIITNISQLDKLKNILSSITDGEYAFSLTSKQLDPFWTIEDTSKNLPFKDFLLEIIKKGSPSQLIFRGSVDKLTGENKMFDFTIGQQTRHILDHYLVFQENCNSAKIDYYLRKRSVQLENERTYALSVINSLVHFMDTVSQDRLILVQSEGRIDTESEFIQSSIAREISFLATHTIHHLAILRIMLQFIGKQCHPETGIAPATIEYARK